MKGGNVKALKKKEHTHTHFKWLKLFYFVSFFFGANWIKNILLMWPSKFSIFQIHSLLGIHKSQSQWTWQWKYINTLDCLVVNTQHQIDFIQYTAYELYRMQCYCCGTPIAMVYIAFYLDRSNVHLWNLGFDSHPNVIREFKVDQILVEKPSKFKFIDG